MKIHILLIVLLTTPLIWSQNYKFGKVSKEELEEAFYPLDSTADAAVLYSERLTNFEYDKEKGFYIVEKYFVRTKIYNQNAYDYATKNIAAYHGSDGEEKVYTIKAKTFNLENGKIKETGLQKKDVFKTQKNKFYNNYNFTMPNVKPGSIIEWKYTISSPYFGKFNEVRLQKDIPIKKLKVSIATPEYFNYNTLTKGFLSIPIKKEKKRRRIAYSKIIRGQTTFSNVSNSKAVQEEFSFTEHVHNVEMEHVPALKKEAFSGNLNNYKAGINYELSYINYPNSPNKTYATDWKTVVKNIYFNSDFGSQISKTRYFKDDLDEIVSKTNSLNEKINIVSQFIKSKIKWNGYYGVYADEGVKQAYELGTGNVADINLSLIAMLKYVDIDANPVLVSTVSHGIPVFPTRNGFNYVIAGVNTPDGLILLDASDKNSLPNVLPDRVLNFKGRLISKEEESKWVSLFPTQHTISKKLVSAKFTDIGIVGTARNTITNNYSLGYRNEAREKNKEAILEWIDEKLTNVDVINARVSNLDNLDKDVIETIQFETESFYEEIGGKTYITPLLYLQLEENPFKSEEREFPVYYNKPWAKVATINLTIPDTFTVESIPEGCEYILPDDLGFFQYHITQKGNIMEIKSSFVINQPVITPQNYKDLKDLYTKTITKQMEKIVLSN